MEALCNNNVELKYLMIQNEIPDVFCMDISEISGLSQSQGSELGGTRLTLFGQHFDETDAPIRVTLGGECVCSYF